MIKVIRPSSGWRGIDWRELFHYRDLLWFLTLRGIKAKYAQSILGVGWAVIQPLLSTLMLTIVFGKLARMDSNGVPYFLFSFTALVPWTFFANTLLDSTNSLVTNSAMLSKVYFPRLVLPLSAMFSKAIDFGISFVLLLIFIFVYQIRPSWEVIWLPWLLLVLIMNSLGIGLILSAMVVQYRDVRHALNFGVQLLMYAAPVVYPTSKIPADFQMLYALNPMVGVIEGFRSSFLGANSFPYSWLLVATVTSGTLLLFGLLYFRRMERFFADVA